MRMKTFLLLLGLSLLNSGCGLFASASRNLVVQPLQCLDEASTSKRNNGLAKTAWKEIKGRKTDSPYSAAYEEGFLEGFADYLDAGGTGEPPAAPPRRYLTVRHQTPAGYQTILDWNAGFRHGASTAEQIRHQRVITVPVTAPLPGTPLLGPTPDSAAPASELPALPEPRKVMPPAGGFSSERTSGVPLPAGRP